MKSVPPGKSPPATRVGNVFSLQKFYVWSRNLCKAISPWYPKRPFFHGWLVKHPFFIYIIWSHPAGISVEVDFLKKKSWPLKWSHCVRVVFLGVEVKDEKNEIRNIYYQRDLEGARTYGFEKWKIAKGVPLQGCHLMKGKPEIYFFYTHSMYPCHVISKTTSFFFGGQEFRTTGGSLPCGGLATAFKIHPGQKITASWSLQIGQGPTGNDMVFKPSILKCKLAVCFREGNTNDLLFKDSLHIANIFCQLGNVWNFEYLIFFTSMSYQHNV